MVVARYFAVSYFHHFAAGVVLVDFGHEFALGQKIHLQAHDHRFVRDAADQPFFSRAAHNGGMMTGNPDSTLTSS